MKVNYNLPNGTETTREVTTIAELEEIGREADDGAIIMSMNGYDYSLCEEDEPLCDENINDSVAFLMGIENGLLALSAKVSRLKAAEAGKLIPSQK